MKTLEPFSLTSINFLRVFMHISHHWCKEFLESLSSNLIFPNGRETSLRIQSFTQLHRLRKSSPPSLFHCLPVCLFACLPVCLFACLLVSKSRNLSLNKLSANFNWRFLSAKTQKPLICFHLWKIMTTKLMGSIGFKQFSHQSWFLIIT